MKSARRPLPQTQLILIRHGETRWTREKRYQGKTDILLTARGRRQARAVARCLRGRGIDSLYTSYLKRARETGFIIGLAIRKRPRADQRLNEIDFGNWEGKTAQEILKGDSPEFRRWVCGEWVTPPGGERQSSFRKRIAGFLREILKRHQGKTVALVSHGGSVKVIIAELLKLPSLSLWAFRVDPASISLVTVDSRFAQLVSLNGASHLRKC